MENTTPKFANDYVSISDTGITLTRSRYPYKHINFSEIEDFDIKEGYLIKNRVAVLILSTVAVIAWGIFLYNLKVIPRIFTGGGAEELFFWGTRPGIAVIAVTIALIFMLYQSFLRSKIVNIKTHDKRYHVRVPELKDEAEADYLRSFLTTKLAK